jgi:hypothetical protein
MEMTRSEGDMAEVDDDRKRMMMTRSKGGGVEVDSLRKEDDDGALRGHGRGGSVL